MENKNEGQKNRKEDGGVAFVAVEENILAPARKDRVLPISIIIAAVMITGAITFATLYKAGGAPGDGGVAGAGAGAGTGKSAPSSASVAAILALGSRDAILGNANAPVTLIEYGDYQCPYCAQYFSTVQTPIVQGYVNSGKVKMVFRNLPFLGPESIAAAQAAECAEDQNKLWAFHDALYTAKLGDDGKGGTENDGSLSRTLFMSIATRLGMDTTAFGSCIDSNKYASLVTKEKSDAETAIGGDSTPTTFINGALVADANGNSVGANATAVLNAVANAVAAAK